MPQSPRAQGFFRNVLDLVEDAAGLFNPNINKDMSHNFGWDVTPGQGQEVWRQMAADPNGRVRVTTGPVLLTGTASQSVTVLTTLTQILQANSKRQFIMIDNLNFWFFRIMFKAGGGGANDQIIFPNDYSLVVDGYQGEVWGISVNQSVTIKVVEV